MHVLVSPSASARRAFTIVELIVVVGILSLLLALLVPAVSGVRASARLTAEQSAARQVWIAYDNYAVVTDGRVLPGYLGGLPARDADGRSIASVSVPNVASRWPWRLAPFLDYRFEGLYLNEHGDVLEELRSADYEDFVYRVSLFPSLGLNSYWVGGHEGVGLGFDPLALRNFGRFYVTQMTDVRRPDRLIAFASSRLKDEAVTGNDTVEGYFTVTAPHFTSGSEDLWSELWDDRLESEDFGHLSLRHRDEALVLMMDGHVEALGESELRDMTRWANGATDERWGLLDE